jgi:hypothetical protein
MYRHYTGVNSTGSAAGARNARPLMLGYGQPGPAAGPAAARPPAASPAVPIRRARRSPHLRRRLPAVGLLVFRKLGPAVRIRMPDASPYRNVRTTHLGVQRPCCAGELITSATRPWPGSRRTSARPAAIIQGYYFPRACRIPRGHGVRVGSCRPPSPRYPPRRKPPGVSAGRHRSPSPHGSSRGAQIWRNGFCRRNLIRRRARE